MESLEKENNYCIPNHSERNIVFICLVPMVKLKWPCGEAVGQGSWHSKMVLSVAAH